MFKCNACWTDLEGKCVATACQHLFCLKCAQQVVENDATCPICKLVITKSTIKVITSLQEASALQLVLCGQAPEATFASALASVQFYVAQRDLQAQLRELQLTKKVSKVQDACRQKLEQVHNGYMQAKRKYEEAMQTCQQLQQDNQELQAKYAQKAMQARKLQEAYKKQSVEMQTLFQQNAQAAAFGNGGLHPRSMSAPMGPPGHTVTAVKRTAVFGSSAPNNLNAFGNTIQPAVLPTSGRVQGITGGYRVPPGGHAAPTSSGGRGFLGGSLDPNSPGGMLMGGTQSVRRPSGGSGGGGQLGSGVVNGGAQNSNNQALRKMLGMPLTQNGGGLGRSGGAMRNDLFSM